MPDYKKLNINKINESLKAKNDELTVRMKQLAEFKATPTDNARMITIDGKQYPADIWCIENKIRQIKNRQKFLKESGLKFYEAHIHDKELLYGRMVQQYKKASMNEADRTNLTKTMKVVSNDIKKLETQKSKFKDM